MSMVDSPDPDYLEKGGPSEKKAPWLLRYGWRLTLIILNVTLLGIVMLLIIQPDFLKANGGLTGQVVNADGSPLPNAVVFVTSAERWVPVDSQGRFAFEGIPAGQTLVLVVIQSDTTSMSGPPWSQAVTVPVGQTADLGALVIADSS
jgi:hypothetical protein